MADSPAAWYHGLPPVTRAMGTAVVATTVATQLGLVSPYALILDWGLVGRFQFWRLVTNFLYVGPFSFPFLMKCLMIHNYGVPLEQVTFNFRTADYLFMLLFGMASFLALSLVSPVPVLVMSSPLIFMLCYIWSRNFPDQPVSIMGFFRVKGFFLPWAWLVITVVMGGSPYSDLMGIFVGHVYYFLSVLYPLNSGRNLLKTPGFVHQLVAWADIGHTPAQPAYRPTYGAFRGRGQRLGNN